MKYVMPPPPGRFPLMSSGRSFLASWIVMACVNVAAFAFIGLSAYFNAVRHSTFSLIVSCLSLASVLMTSCWWAFSVFRLMRVWNEYRKIYAEMRAALDERQKEEG